MSASNYHSTGAKTYFRNGFWFSIRHWQVPTPNSCRWCGIAFGGHAFRWVPSHGWHIWVEPTDAQRKARMKAWRGGL